MVGFKSDDDGVNQGRRRLLRLPPRSGSRLAAAEVAALQTTNDSPIQCRASTRLISGGRWAQKKESKDQKRNNGVERLDVKAFNKKKLRKKSPGQKYSVVGGIMGIIAAFFATNLGRSLEMGNDTTMHFVNIEDDDEGSDLKFYNNRTTTIP